jgi:adenylate kinase
MGAPGSGKGTQATLVSETLNLYYLETSRLLEEKFNQVKKTEVVKIGGTKYSLVEEKKRWQTGLLNSSPWVSFLMNKKMTELAREGRGVVLAGAPRDLEQGKAQMPFFEKLYGKKNIKIVFLEISAKESIFRNSRRKLCELFRHPILYSQENARLKHCPLDGSKLMKRKGLDNPETIKTRLKVYREQTLPLYRYFKTRKLMVKKVNGMPAPAIVFKNILRALN